MRGRMDRDAAGGQARRRMSTMSKQAAGALSAVTRWVDATFIDLARQLRWSFLPPLMVYFAAGVAGLTSVVGAFFVKDYLSLSAAFLAGLTFWAGLPWVLKMPIGHLVDLFWRWKGWIVVAGAALIAASLSIMIGLITERDAMAAILPVETWFIISALLSPTGYVLQDVVADAMTVEAIPPVDASGAPLSDAESKAQHTTMQTLGRFAIISGFVSVAIVNIVVFANVEAMDQADKILAYARVYEAALIIPIISVSGVILGAIMLRRRAARLKRMSISDARLEQLLTKPEKKTELDWQILAGGAAFVVITLGLGLSGFDYAAETVFFGTLSVVWFLIARLCKALTDAQARALVGTAVVIFVFRAVPLPGPGLTWFEIDELGFDERFLSVLSLITSALTLAGLVLLRPIMVRWSIVKIVGVLAVAGGILSLPNIALYYGLHEWTAPLTGGVVDARFIAILDTAVESPLGQISMIPMLAWIARNAPRDLKATFFAVMASFTNLALSASSLGTKAMNSIFVVTRATDEVPADYSELGHLLITVAVLSVVLPLITIWLVQQSRFRVVD